MESVETVRELLAQTAGGDREAFARLYDGVVPQVLGVTMRVLGERAEAEEATLDTFVQVWLQASRYDPSRAEPIGWILMQARTRALDRLRSRTRKNRLTDELSSSAEPVSGIESPEEAQGRTERAEQLQTALATLPAEQRTALEAVYFGGLSHREVAAAQQLPLGTVKTRVRNGLLALRRRLDAGHGGVA